MTRRAFLAHTLVLGLAGCALGRSSPESVAYYDLGMAPAAQAGARLSRSLALDEVAAGPWLQTQGILYRLAYRDPAQLLAYTRSRWTAAPALLLTHRLRLALTHATPHGVTMLADGVSSEQILKLELEAFEQRIHSPTAGEAIVTVRASLIDASSRRLHAQRMLTGAAPCPSVDAEGAVRGLRIATDELLTETIQWLEKAARPAPKAG